MTKAPRKPKTDDLPFDDEEGMFARAGGIARDNPVAAGGAVVMALTGCLIVANALGLQSGRHPAPLFVTRDRDEGVARSAPADIRRSAQVQEISSLVLDLQTALRRSEIYEGPLDGVNGPATERAIRHYERILGRVETGEPSEALLANLLLNGASAPAGGIPAPRPKPGATAQSVPAEPAGAPTAVEDPRLAAIQQLLSDLGYGPLSADGVMGDNTSAAIQRFELDRGLPITGRPTPQVVEWLEMVSGEKVGI